MENNINDFDDLFREELSGYAETPPPAVWQALEQRLDHKKKRRAFPLRWFWYISVLSFITLLGASIAWKTSDSGRNATVVTDNIINEAGALAPTAGATPVVHSNTAMAAAVNHETGSTLHQVEPKISKSSQSNSEKTATTRKFRKSRKAQRSVDQTEMAATPAPESTIGNAATVGTSMHSYDDFENTTKPEEELSPVIADAGSSKAGYVVHRRRKHNMLVVEMNPMAAEDANNKSEGIATTEAHKIQDERTESISEEDSKNGTAATARPKREKHNRIAETPVVAASVPASMVRKRDKTTPATTVEVAKTSNNSKSTTAKASSPAVAVVVSPTRKRAPVATTRKPNETSTTISELVSGINSASVTNSKTATTMSGSKLKDNEVVKPASVAVVTSVPAEKAHMASYPANKQTGTRQAAVAQKEPVKSAAVATVGAAPVVATQKVAGTTTAANTSANNKVRPVSAGNSVSVHNVAATKAISPKVHTATAKTVETVAQNATTEKENKKSATNIAVAKKAESDVKQTSVSAVTKAGRRKKEQSTSKTESAIAVVDRKEQKHSVASTKTSITARNTQNATPVSGEIVAARRVAKVAGKQPAAKRSIPAVPGAGNNVATGTAPVLPVAAKQPVATNTNATKSPVLVSNNTMSGAASATIASILPDLFPASAPSPVTTAPTDSVLVATKEPELVSAQKQLTKQGADKTEAADPGQIRKLIYGIKGGFESGVSMDAANKVVVSPYFSYAISKKMSLMVQPSIKGANLRNSTIGSPVSYFDVDKSSGKFVQTGSSIIALVFTGDSAVLRDYAYTETHDSIVKSTGIGGTYVELELPLLLRYSLSPRLSVYGGLNTVYGKQMGLKENTFIQKAIEKTAPTATLAPIGAPAPDPQAPALTYAGNSFSGYVDPHYPANPGASFRMGYMLGFSYEIKKRWMADVLLQQCIAKPKMYNGIDANAALSKPYLRVTLGYRLSK